MASKLDICNRALTKLGQTRITSMADTDKVSSACNNAFEPVKRALFRAHPWNFTITRSKITGVATTDIPEYDYQFTIPSDCLKILQIYDLTFKEWAVEGSVILANDGPDIYLRYQKDLTYVTDSEATVFDDLFVEAMASKLAYELCELLTQSNSKKAEAAQDFRLAMAEAKRNDAQEGSAATFETSDWVTVRY